MCFRYLGFTTFEQFDRLTLDQMEILSKALELREEDKNFEAHRQAFLNFKATATKESGNKIKPVYNDFRSFYNIKKRYSRFDNKKKEKSKFEGVGKLLAKGV